MKLIKLLCICCFYLTSCSAKDNDVQNINTDDIPITNEETEDNFEMETTQNVVAQSVSFSGEEGNYTVSVTLLSPDMGCDQYADWWEIITEDGALVYRRILAHSHVNEQPFSRSGSAIDVQANETLIIRGHMNNLGYGTSALKGSVESGFETVELEDGFASDLSETAPLPDGCAF